MHIDVFVIVRVIYFFNKTKKEDFFMFKYYVLFEKADGKKVYIGSSNDLDTVRNAVMEIGKEMLKKREEVYFFCCDNTGKKVEDWLIKR
jgi:hypothetical protein